MAQKNLAPPSKVIVKHRHSALRNVRLGVVAESRGNSSPGLCLQHILTELTYAVLPTIKLDLYFFTRNGMDTVFASALKNVSIETYVLDESDIKFSTGIISDVQLDILLYIALPTERFTVTMAHYRLAPIQIQYGLGHPLSSGILNSMDFSIISSSMIWSGSDLRTVGERLNGKSNLLQVCIEAANSCSKPSNNGSSDEGLCYSTIPEACMSYGHNALYYTEQVVLFESNAFHVQDFALYHFESENDVLMLHVGKHCDNVTSFFESLGLPISSTDLGCGDDAFITPRLHLYNCIQHGKKMHPDFDKALYGIWKSDPKAVFLLNNGFRDNLIKRWKKNWNITERDIYDKFFFLPRLDHGKYLRLLSYSAVFLNPFPFGSGITSSDAISVCVPLVLLPERISVLPFALSQVRALGQSYVDLFVMHNLDQYIHSAVTIASRAYSEEGFVLRRNMCSDKLRLFSPESLRYSVSEWATFLTNVVSKASSS